MSNAPSINGLDVAKTLGTDKPRSKMRWLRRLVLLAILLGLAGFSARTWMNRQKTNPVAYETQEITRGNLVVTVSATGTLEPIKQVDVGIEVSGTVKAVYVDYNDHVEVGQVLAEIDTSKLDAQALQSSSALEAARAKLLQAQATVQEAEAQMKRLDEVRKLSNGKMPSQNEFDAQKASLARAKADVASAKAAVAQAQATLDANRSDQAKAVVHSPINGVVLTRSTEPGQTVAATFQAPVLFTLAEDLAQMELQVDVDEADVGQVKEGQDATFTVDAYPDEVFPANLTQVRYGSETVDGVVTYKAVLKVDNTELKLRPGMTATALITVNRRENVLLTPNAALRFMPPKAPTASAPARRGNVLSAILPHPPMMKPTQHGDVSNKGKEQAVWTLREGQLSPVKITKGLTDGKMTEVVSGDVDAGMIVVTGSAAGAL